ncbi:MAG TPA: ABC transporter ATP-binding protein [Burkholderiales bacterium]|nr:ABC transporter ATP-binding protein [Burkholderiales bacterium]
MLEVSALRGGYGRVEVLRGIDLAVRAGEIVALLGSNGAGKTTLNNTLSGLLPPFSGTIRFADRSISGARYTEIVAAGLVHVPEGRRVFPNLSLLENLELGAYRRARTARTRNLEHVFSIFPKLRSRAAQRAGTLSGGEQQMLAIGRGLMAEPRLLVLDEPSLGLSPALVEELFALIRRLNGEGLPILLVEQNVGQSLEIAHRAYVLENGAIAFQGTPAELLANAELKRAYLGL